MVFICLLSAFACVGMHVFKWTQQLNKAVLLQFFIIFIYSFVVCVFVVVDVCFVVVVFGGMVIDYPVQCWILYLDINSVIIDQL